MGTNYFKGYKIDKIDTAINEIIGKISDERKRLEKILDNKGLHEKEKLEIKASLDRLITGEQISIKIFDKNEYEENSEDYNSAKTSKFNIREDISEKYIAIMTKFRISEPSPSESLGAFYLNLEKEFDKKIDIEKIEYITENEQFIKKSILNSIPYNIYVQIKPKENEAPTKINEFVNLMYEDVKQYYDPYAYISNRSGYYVGIYKNNGNLFKKDIPGRYSPDIYDENILSMAYIRKSDYKKGNEALRIFLRDMIAQGVSTSVGFLAKEMVKVLKSNNTLHINQKKSI